jgi:hypothetical protein
MKNKRTKQFQNKEKTSHFKISIQKLRENLYV